MTGAPRAEPVAIVGAACRLPGAPDLEAFWRLLVSGTDAVGTLPADRFTQQAYLHPRKGEPGRSYSFAAGHLGDISGFDAPAFGLSPREAAEMDPQQRLLLEVASEAVEDAGWPASRLAGRPVGAFVGGSSTDYAELRLGDSAGADRYFMTGNTLSILSNRLTNVFDLRGAGQTVDTACSSSLVALHLAVQAMRAGQIEAALVGGVQLLLSPFAFAGFSRAGMLSARGRCQAFDAAADGYVRGEGAGVLVLKPLSAALADGDRVRGVILGSGTNAAGRTIGLSLPNREAQATLLARVLAEAGAQPRDIAYFEAHGTGTQAGDPAETWAIGTALARDRAEPLPVGSVKTNIGHLEPASGIAGLLKAMLVLERGTVPPNLHFNSPNPNIDFAGLNIRVPTVPEPLALRPGAMAGINSFGFGGTNATVLLGAAPARPAVASKQADGALPPLLLSAHSEGALKTLARRWRDVLATPEAAADAPALLRGALRHRDLRPHRLALRAESASALQALIESWLAGGQPRGATRGTARPLAEGPVAFVFSGNGAQFAGMAKEAMAHNPFFRATVEEADAVLAPLTGWSGAKLLAEGVTEEVLEGTDYAQPLLFLVQLGVVAALERQGLRPGLCLGHSVGEVAAACTAGILTLPQAARLVVARSRAQHMTRGQGRMAAIGAGPDAAAPLLAEAGMDESGWAPEIAAFNAPDSITVAGPLGPVTKLVELAKARRIPAVLLGLDYAFHSAAMEPVRQSLAAELKGLSPSQGRLLFLSSVTGTLVPGLDLDAGYWWRNLRAPVRFQAAAQAAVDAGARLFIEIGPNPVLQSYLRDSLRAAEAEAPVMPSLSRRDGAGDPFPAMMDRAFAQGADPRGAAIWAGPSRRDGLPATPFDRRSHWFASTPESIRLTDPLLDHPLLGFRQGNDLGRWSRLLDSALEPWLADHALAGEAVLPAAGMAEMALAAAAAQWPDAPVLELRELQLLRTLPVPQDSAREVRFTLETENGLFRIESRPRLSAEAWTLHARGQVGAATLAALPDSPLAGLPESEDPAAMVVTGEQLQATARRFGLDYGPAFRPVREIRIAASGDAALARLALPEEAPGDDAFLLHPVRLDGALQGLLELMAHDGAQDGRAMVPVRFGRLVLRRGGAAPVRAELAVTHRGQRSGRCSLALRDGAGQMVAWLDDAWMQGIRLGQRRPAADSTFRVAEQPALGAPEAGAAPPLDDGVKAALARDADLELAEPGMLLEGHVIASAHAALLARAGADALLPAAGLSPYARALLHALSEDGLAEATPEGWRLLPGEELPAAEGIWQAVLAESPTLAHELAWLALAAERLPAALDGQPQPEAPPAPEAAGFARLAGVMAEAAARIAAAWPMERPLRVLEVGAQGGPLTRALLAALERSGRQIRYTATAPAGDTRAAAIPPHGERVTFSFAAWDGGTALPGPADLVVGLAAAARARLGEGLLPAVAAALAPGGSLLLAEPLPGRAWIFAHGQEEGFWDGRGPGGALLPDQEAWESAFQAEGTPWEDARLHPLGAAPWPALLLAARRTARAEAEAAAPTATATFRLFADEDAAPLAEALAEALEAAGMNITHAALAEAGAQPPRALSGAQVVVLAAPQAPGLAATLAQITALAEAARGAAAGFTLVAPGGDAAPEAAACIGLGRVLANEMPELKLRRITLDAAVAEAAARLLPELLGTAPEPEPELRLTRTARLVPRVVPGLSPASPHLAGDGGARRLAIRQPGQLGSLEWEPMPALENGPEDVVVRVEACGLNFRDLMWAQGLLPEEALMDGFAGPSLGMEMAGVVESAPAGSGFAAGDRVFGVAPAALASRARTRPQAIAHLPEGLDFAAAATVPVAFLTAVYALETCANLQPGETVLVHGGAGAVGLAALQVARAAGARVAATAGSPAKRAFLRAAGAELVLDSRDPGFADQLRAAWPEGVDVVLNSLAGTAMERSLELTKPFGRFIELGKRDFFENTRVGLRPWRRNLTYFGVDVDQLPKARPDLAQGLLRRIAQRLAEGALHPLPHAVRGPAEAEAAFRTLQASAQIGKLVLTPPAARATATTAPAAWTPPEGTILVVGGTQGFGFECAKWLAANGATRLALLSRRGGTAPGAEAAVRALAALGAAATVHAADAADARALEAALREIRAEGPKLVGVVHAAAVFDDGAASTMDARRFARVLAPKLDAALNLDRLTRRDPLALFLLFSSATTAMGNPGQANYVAANAALEALARRRRAEGLPALAVGWGPIADAGVLAENASTAETLARRLGVESMTATESLNALPALLASGAPVLSLARIGWRQAGMALPILEEPLFDAVRGQREVSAEGGDLRARLLEMPPEEARALLRQLVREEAGRILRLPPEAIPTDAPVAGMGLDSLGGLELRGALEQRLGMSVPLASVTEDLTIDLLARRLSDGLSGGRVEETVADMVEQFEPSQPAAPQPPAEAAE
ncbi:type I polyketide synthase [Roseomonas marmotae]|uniref:SDR family NAD(P)-dependent oxidoreductase n=1 Tax=Roseomonas marmotae TaxID=2768161 RepID=A0ABS3K810_9PROT|nr:type I polyketide synthase [Roseomonas marmotae]MBO1073055.1 SDR family NAD(P)-dependent oxidoreductase [Roseomonas marmotae]QTI79300.1 SDR family NAD(P)-dependent oxidoreductase [Roseomonas marmotae]